MQHFPAAVVDPVRMHVNAKRYLATAEEGYAGMLSAASVLSLKLQGGPMSREEAIAFASETHFQQALQLRRWDEEGKIVGFTGPTIDDFMPAVRACMLLR